MQRAAMRRSRRACLESSCRTWQPAVRGFTLVELLVAFAIAALLVALAPVAFDRLRESMQYRSALRGIMGELRWAQNEAFTKGIPVRFQFDLARREYGLQGRAPKQISSSLDVRATIASSELSPGQVASIVFLPDGGATGGTFEILRPSGTGTRIRVDWLTGRVEQEAFSP